MNLPVGHLETGRHCHSEPKRSGGEESHWSSIHEILRRFAPQNDISQNHLDRVLYARLVLALVLWSSGLSGCSLTKPQPAVHHYTLTVTVPEAAASTARTSLIVRPFAAADPYNQERLVYRSSAYQVDFYNYHRPHGSLGGQTPYERLKQKTASVTR